MSPLARLPVLLAALALATHTATAQGPQNPAPQTPPAAAPQVPSPQPPKPAAPPGPASAASAPGPAPVKPAPPNPAAANPAPAAQVATSHVSLTAADIAFIDRVTWGVNESTVAEYQALGRDRWLERQLHPGRDRLPPAAQDIIRALPITTKSLTEIAFPLTAQQRNTNQIPDPEQRKVLQQAFQQELNELGRQAATRSLLRDLYSPDQLREKMTWFWFN